RYGKVFKSHIFGSATIVSTDADVNKFILQSDAKVFVPSYPKSLMELMGESSILLINGTLQRRIHGLIGAFFKSQQLKVQITKDMQKNNDIHSWFQAKKKMVKLVRKNIQARRNKDIFEVPKDVVDVLLNDTSEKLTDDLIADNIIDMMIPGEDSVPVLMTLATKYLSECPAALQQLTEENIKIKKLKDEIGEPMCWSDYLSLPFTQKVITETLRMGNIINGVMRKALKDVEIKGYLIPQGWCVFANFRSVHLDEKNYECPYQFNPWRWQDKDMNCNNFTPFGGGQRLCPGLDLARLEASIFLHHLVTQFRWYAKEDTIVNFPTVRMKRRMPILLKRV
ncbi:3-epi-6-deoxocathasterone 23-monooxygenase-like protein, partial [Trifolium pratense]